MNRFLLFRYRFYTRHVNKKNQHILYEKNMGKVWFWLKRNNKWRKQYRWCINFEGKKVYIVSFPNLVEPSLDAGRWNWGGDRRGARGHFIIVLVAGIVVEQGGVWRWCCVRCCCNDHLCQQKSTCICFLVLN